MPSKNSSNDISPFPSASISLMKQVQNFFDFESPQVPNASFSSSIESEPSLLISSAVKAFCKFSLVVSTLLSEASAINSEKSMQPELSVSAIFINRLSSS